LKIPITERAGGVAQGEGPVLKKKKKEVGIRTVYLSCLKQLLSTVSSVDEIDLQFWLNHLPVA
jgi:hypothetical protein